jgi:hypothetical protein
VLAGESAQLCQQGVDRAGAPRRRIDEQIVEEASGRCGERAWKGSVVREAHVVTLPVLDE